MADYRYQSSWKLPAWLGWGGLLFLSVLFYRERTLFIDIAYQTFLMITEGGWQVQVDRYGSILVHLLPKIGIALSLPLNWILILYSISFPLIFWGYFWLTRSKLKNDYLALALLLLFTLVVQDAFYWTTSELLQGLAFLFPFFAFLLRWPTLNRWWHWAVLIPASVILVFYHPLMVIPFGYMWGYFWLRQKTLRKLPYLILAAVVPGLYLFKKAFLPNWYDSGKYRALSGTWDTYGLRFWEVPAFGKMLDNGLSLWYMFPVVLLVVSLHFIRQRHWWRLLWMWGFCVVFLGLINLGAPNATDRFYMEVNYLPVMAFVLVPLCMDVLPPWSGKKWWPYALALLIGWRILAIGLHHRPYTDRLDWLRQTIETAEAQSDSHHYAALPDQVPMDTVLITWGLAYESLLLTACERTPEAVSTFAVLPDTSRYRAQLQSDDYLLSQLIDYPHAEVNGRYFGLKRGRYYFIQGE